ncbi:MAG: hypothetical protein RMI91_03470 [Gemmatales bacterium]|nr:hypothetical protein [Gemmatales bacterium]MDW7993691.1 hypothetical protein [Gemmatales bacterium]
MLLLVKVLILYAVLVGLLWLVSLFLHYYLYTQQPEGLVWRVPLAAGVIVVVCLIFPLVMAQWWDQVVPITMGQIFLDTTPPHVIEFDQIEVMEAGRKVIYRREGKGIGPDNFVAPDRRRFPRDIEEFTAVTRDEEQRIKFQAMRRNQDNARLGGTNQVYVSEQGHRMGLGELGRIELGSPGTRALSLLVVVLGLGSWIGSFLLLQFNFGHALGLGIGLYLAWLFLMGFVF